MFWLNPSPLRLSLARLSRTAIQYKLTTPPHPHLLPAILAFLGLALCRPLLYPCLLFAAWASIHYILAVTEEAVTLSPEYIEISHRSMMRYRSRRVSRERLEATFIHETISYCRMYEYLGFLVRDEDPILVAFATILPDLRVLKMVYRDALEIVFDEKVRRRGDRGERVPNGAPIVWGFERQWDPV